MTFVIRSAVHHATAEHTSSIRQTTTLTMRIEPCAEHMSSSGITEPDNVTIYFYHHMLKLAEETAEECFKKGADVLLNLYTDRFYARCGRKQLETGSE